MPLRAAPPIVAIVGRPNVGKSRLFNRYAGSRRALVEDHPGITRDRIAEEITVTDRRILLVDTAGLVPNTGGGGLAAAVQAQAETAVAEADAILFVVDGRAGLLPEDESIARTLRRSDKPLSVVVNKIDHAKQIERVAEFHRLGLEPMHAISAEHGGGAWDALEELVAALPEGAAPGEAEGPAGIGIAIVGRPNVGKSSLANRLLGVERLVVSDRPGTTRDRIDVPFERDGTRYLLMDTAGLRRPGRRNRTAERGSALMTVRSLERADVALLVVDSAEGLTDQDAHVASAIVERGCACVVIANKWDRVGARGGEDIDPKRVREQIAHGLRFLPDPPILAVSAQTGAAVGRVLPAVREVAAAASRRIATPELNRWLQEAVRHHEPPVSRKGGRSRVVKLRYATQVAVGPPTVVLFCNEPQAVSTGYRRYLENQLRGSFDFRGTPVRLRLRAPGDKPGRGKEEAAGPEAGERRASPPIHSAPGESWDS